MRPSLTRVVRGALPILVLLPFFLILSSCRGTGPREAVSPTQAHMFAHYDRATEVHDALVRGDLDRAKGAAEWIATHQEPRSFPGNAPSLQAEMQRFANQVAWAGKLEEATWASAHMGRTCGDCHRQNAVEPRFLVGPAPPGGTGPQAEMERHVWASERMWDGLVGPEDHAWRSGAEALKGGWLDPQEVVSNPEDRTRIRELVRQVYDLGLEAESIEDSDARADLYGRFLITCNECHVLTAARIH